MGCITNIVFELHFAGYRDLSQQQPRHVDLSLTRIGPVGLPPSASAVGKRDALEALDHDQKIKPVMRDRAPLGLALLSFAVRSLEAIAFLALGSGVLHRR